jgi:hypothetical protein
MSLSHQLVFPAFPNKLSDDAISNPYTKELQGCSLPRKRTTYSHKSFIGLVPYSSTIKLTTAVTDGVS